MSNTEKRSLFSRTVLIVCALSVLLCGIGAFVFWQYLDRYEHSRPEYFARQILQAFNRKDIRTLSRYADLPDSLQQPEHLTAYLEQEIGTSDLRYALHPGNHGSDKVYQMRTKTKVIALLTVSSTGNRDLGLEYSIRSLEFLPLHTYTFTVSSEVQLYVNGQKLPQKYLVEQRPCAEAFAQLQTVYTTDTYVIDELFYLYSAEAIDAAGNPAELQIDMQTHTVTCSVSGSSETERQIRDFAQSLMRPYLIFCIKKNGPIDPILSLLHPDTAFARHIKQYDNANGYTYSGDRLEQMQIDNVKALSATDWQCNISLTYVITSGQEEIRFPLQKTLYITNRNGMMQLVDMTP